MEYILGSAITLVSVIVLNRLLRNSLNENKINVKISQSYLYKLMSEYDDRENNKSFVETQSFKHIKDQYVRIMIVDTEAYWIRNNQLYVADFIDGEIDTESTKEVDTIAMDPVELKKTMFVVEKLTEGETDDLGGPGKS